MTHFAIPTPETLNRLIERVTRGKKLVILVGTKKALYLAVRRQDTARRYTALRGRVEKT